MALDKSDLFWVGNVIGLVALLVVIAIVAPQKAKERQEYLDKQKSAASVQTGVPAPNGKDASVVVVTAAKNISSGSTVQADDIALKSPPRDPTNVQALTSLKQALGRPASHDINVGQPIQDSDLKAATP